MKKDTEVVGQCMKLKSDLVVTEPLAGQTGPGDSVLAFLDVLFCGSALIVEPKQFFRRKGEVGHDEAKAWEQFTGVPFDFGGNPAGFFP